MYAAKCLLFTQEIRGFSFTHKVVTSNCKTYLIEEEDIVDFPTAVEHFVSDYFNGFETTVAQLRLGLHEQQINEHDSDRPDLRQVFPLLVFMYLMEEK